MEETWSCIPTLLLWMIMKRLRFIDNLHLSAVCKHWLNAFHNFPEEEQIPPMSSCNFPWLMITKDHRGSEREFFSPWTKTKFTVDLPEFAKTIVLLSKNGWVLLSTCSDCCKQVPRVFLLNPFTRVKLEMPTLPRVFRAYMPSGISMLEGTPNCVALGDRCLAIAHPGDNAWKIFTVPLEICQPMFFVDRYLYLIDKYYGRVLRFNTIDFTMTKGFMGKEVNQFGIEGNGSYFLQCNKEIIGVCSTTSTGRLTPYGHFSMNGFVDAAWAFYKYSFSKAAWEALADDEIRGKSWFLSNCGAKFASAAEGTTVERVHFLSKLKRRASYWLFSRDLNSLGKDAHSYFGNLSRKSTVWINMG
ncbi:hypothetical protein RHMOL_Rhmol05G0026000 [Rhododendron molle]|uniref:Uncharacterized protein n=1 Tax=Rhododendron molle TaxID=49168 RepID=A0ACC0NL89_RHOML|nr:hypothetical protein RHMOL_Rhmol05G0026000 [Rhododendron molle]